jgi:hypothetical protein
VLEIHDEAEIEEAVTALVRESAGGLMVAPDPFINTRRWLIMATLPTLRRRPALSSLSRLIASSHSEPRAISFFALSPPRGVMYFVPSCLLNGNAELSVRATMGSKYAGGRLLLKSDILFVGLLAN